MVRIGLIRKVTYEQRCEGCMRVIHVELWAKCFLGKGRSQCKGLGAGAYSECLEYRIGGQCGCRKGENGSNKMKEATIQSYWN